MENVVIKPQKNSDTPKHLYEHLDDLRKHLIRSLVAIVAIATIAFFTKDFFFDYLLLGPISENFITYKLLCKLSLLFNTPSLCINVINIKLINIDIAGQFKAHVFFSLVIGLLIAFPFIIWQLWLFVKPGLKIFERRWLRKNISIILLLFFMGIVFGYFVITPFTVLFFANYQVTEMVQNTISLASYMNTVISIILASGFLFEIPLVVAFLTYIGLINYNFLRKYRKHAFIISFVVSAIVTPPDAFSMIIMALPVYMLYEISIGVARKIEKKRIIQMQ